MFITTRVSLSICLLLTSLLVVQCQDDEFFVAQEDWQEIREGQKVPGGLHYRMNLETGKKEAKLLSLEDTDSGKGIRLQMFRKDIEHLYHAFMCSPLSLLSGIYPIPAMHSSLRKLSYSKYYKLRRIAMLTLREIHNMVLSGNKVPALWVW